MVLNPAEVTGLIGEDGANRPGQDRCGDGSTTAGCDHPGPQEFGEPIGGEEGDCGDTTASAEGAPGGDANLVRRHDDRNRRKAVGCLVPVNRGGQRFVGWRAVRGRRDVDGHLLPIVRTARDTGAVVTLNLDR